jgi:ketosteroid isomerase-like protein
MKNLFCAAIFIASVVFNIQAQTAPDAGELAKLLNDFLAGASRNDVAMHERFWADDVIYTGSGGRRRGKADIMKDVGSAPAPKPGDAKTTYTAEDVRIQQYGNTAIVAFRLVATTGKNGTTEVANYLNTGTFLKRKGKWQVVSWQATKLAAAADAKREASTTEKELVAIAQELYDAIAVGNKEPWQKYLADDAIYTDENWKISTKKDLVEGLRPLPTGYSGTIRIANVQSRISGDAAVLSHRALEEETIFGQKITPTYLVTTTFFKRDGRWQMVASHASVMPSERKAIVLRPEQMASIVGEYELTPRVTYTITLEDGKLIGQRTGRAKEELLPADANTFFRKGSIRGEKVFVRDAGGRVTQMLDRRENNDLMWKKIK